MAKPSVVFVLGGPGAGKGTQCAKIEEHFGFKHVSAGDCLREERNTPGSQYGELIESYIREGEIVPVDITVNLLKKKMEQHGWNGGKFLIDGFPRNEENLDGWYKVIGDAADDKMCLFFDCPETVMEARLLERGKTSGRSDDNIESIRKRFKTFVSETMPIIKSFEAKGKSKHVIADRPVDAVWAEVQEVFSNIEKHGNLRGA